mgnify:CR=1 FL=1
MRRIKELVLNNFLVVRAVFMREILYWIRYPMWFLTFFSFPYLVSGLFYSIGYALSGENATKYFSERAGTTNVFLYQLVGSAIFIISILMIEEVGYSIRAEQLRGTLEYNYIAKANKIVLWGSVVLPHGLVSLSTLAISLIPALYIGLKSINPLDLILGILVLFIGLLPLFGIGFIVAALTMRFKEPWAVTNIIKAFLSAFSGFNYPITILPLWLQYVSNMLPTTIVTNIIREAILFNRKLYTMNYQLGLLIFMSTIYSITAFTVYKKWEMEARKRGELSKY